VQKIIIGGESCAIDCDLNLSIQYALCVLPKPEPRILIKVVFQPKVTIGVHFFRKLS
jgi:hypothetical protein